MLFNYLFFLGYLIGVWVVKKSFMLGLLYNFSIILIFQKHNRFEFFNNYVKQDINKYQKMSLANCNYNIPLYVTNGEFISIDLDFYQQCNEESKPLKKSEPLDPCNDDDKVLNTSNKPQLLNGISSQKSIYINPKIILDLDLHNRIKKGDKITIDGTPVDPKKVYTVHDLEFETSQLKLNQQVPEFKMKKGTITIYFLNTHQTINNTVLDKGKMYQNINNIDKEITNDRDDMSQIINLKNKIINNNKLINNLKQQNMINQNKIFKNKEMINEEQMQFNNFTFYIDKLENNPDLTLKNIMQKTQKERNKIVSQIQNKKDQNEVLKNQIYTNKQTIINLRKENISYQDMIGKISNEMIQDSDIFTQNNQDISKQNNNFNKFISSCELESPQRMFPIKKDINKCPK